jgi:hypothetical protein
MPTVMEGTVTADMVMVDMGTADMGTFTRRKISDRPSPSASR